MADLSDSALLCIRQLIADLVAGRVDVIARDGRIGRLSQEELLRALDDYPGTLVDPPEGGLPQLDVYRQDADPNGFAVNVPLWTREEGMSDLTLSLTVLERGGDVRVFIDDLHVL